MPLTSSMRSPDFQILCNYDLKRNTCVSQWQYETGSEMANDSDYKSREQLALFCPTVIKSGESHPDKARYWY
jgi:hypothetical protein